MGGYFGGVGGYFVRDRGDATSLGDLVKACLDCEIVEGKSKRKQNTQYV